MRCVYGMQVRVRVYMCAYCVYVCVHVCILCDCMCVYVCLFVCLFLCWCTTRVYLLMRAHMYDVRVCLHGMCICLCD